jgi:hypothetical protein
MCTDENSQETNIWKMFSAYEHWPDKIKYWYRRGRSYVTKPAGCEFAWQNNLGPSQNHSTMNKMIIDYNSHQN